MPKNTVKGALPLPQALSPSSRGDSIFRTRLTSLEPRPTFPYSSLLVASQSCVHRPLPSAWGSQPSFCSAPWLSTNRTSAPLYPTPTLLTWRSLVCLRPAPRPSTPQSWLRTVPSPHAWGLRPPTTVPRLLLQLWQLLYIHYVQQSTVFYSMSLVFGSIFGDILKV